MDRYQQIGYGLGSEIQITLVTSKSQAFIDKQFKEIWAVIKKFESKFSRFIKSSELTKFNESAGRKTKVSDEFLSLLLVSKSQSLKRDGLFNPFILPALQRAGYLSSWPNPDLKSEINFQNANVVNIDKLRIGDNWARIPKLTAIDFGGIGKGYLLDLLFTNLQDKIQGFWISIGGDIVCYGKDHRGKHWKVKVQDSLNPKKTVGTIANQNGEQLGIATSGITKRKGINNGIAWHHIIDPRINLPAETDILTATVCAPSATDADIIAKCLVILGSKKSQDFVNSTTAQQTIIQIRANINNRSVMVLSRDKS